MDEHHRPWIVELSESECWERAATEPVGRIAWTGPLGPTIVPLNFVIVDRAVHVRTAAYSALARECDDNLVAFEVDSYNRVDRSGWSVVMRGRACIVYPELGQPVGLVSDPWPAGVRTLHLQVEVDQVTGRAL